MWNYLTRKKIVEIKMYIVVSVLLFFAWNFLRTEVEFFKNSMQKIYKFKFLGVDTYNIWTTKV